MYEDLKKQWDKDVEWYGTEAYKLWQYKPPFGSWVDCDSAPLWCSACDYRRKEPEFKPEYFSGLNWRGAGRLVGEMVEVSNDGEDWFGPFELRILSLVPTNQYFQADCVWWTYIRTCPETYQDNHPTITIGGVKLPRPEIDAPEDGTEYWIFDVGESYKRIWGDSRRVDAEVLPQGIVHLTESRAQAWADWWDEVVVGQIKDK